MQSDLKLANQYLFKMSHSLKNFCEYELQITAAFQKDVEKFLEEFESLQSYNYEVFAILWRKHNLTFVFGDQTYLVLLKQICTNYFLVVKKYLVFPQNLYIKVGAFYLLYGLYYKQPVENLVKIRLIKDEYKILMDLVETMQEKQQKDFLFIFLTLLRDGAIEKVAEHKPLGPEDSILRTYRDFSDDTFKGASNQVFKDFKQFMESDDLIGDYDRTCKEYDEAFAAFKAKEPEVVITSFKSELKECVENLYREYLGPGKQSVQKEEESIESKRKKIREKAAKFANE